MNLKNRALWEEYEDKNKDPYGGSCVNVARKVMEFMDEPGTIDAHDLVHRANHALDAGITGFMAGCVAQMVSRCHERGKEFETSWNKCYGIEEKPEQGNSNEPPAGGTVNPAILTISKSNKG